MAMSSMGCAPTKYPPTAVRFLSFYYRCPAAAIILGMIKSAALKIWRGICWLAIKIFYRHYEVAGFENIPQGRGVIFCANHVNALVDPILVQAASKKLMRPLARSGLFEKIWLKPVLEIIGAVPVYRSSDVGSDVTRNQQSFARVYELLEKGEWIIIFPEGQSHSQSKIQRLKTGAARMALGTLDRGKMKPVLLPVGLTFTKKGEFRGDVLVYFGQPVDLAVPEKVSEKLRVRVVTRRLTEGLSDVTINTDNWEDLELVSKVERFYAMRSGKYHKSLLVHRFASLKRIIARHRLLRKREPELIEQVTKDLRRFESVCRSVGIKGYHLDIAYRPFLVVWYSIKLLFILLVSLPLFFWGVINSFIPYWLSRWTSRYFAKSLDQFDTAKILSGIFWFTIFWVIQILLVYRYAGINIAVLYFLSLVVSTAVIIRMQKEIFHIKENIYVFLLFLRNRGLKEHLISHRNNIERELARLVKIANRL